MIGDKEKAIRNKAKQRQRTDGKKLAVEAIANINCGRVGTEAEKITKEKTTFSSKNEVLKPQ